MDGTHEQDGPARRAGRALGRSAWAGAQAGGRLAGRALSTTPQEPPAPPHAVLSAEALARALADLARAEAGEPVEQGAVPDPVAFSWPRRVRPHDREDGTPDGVVDLVDPSDHDRLVGAVLVGLTDRDLTDRPLGRRILHLAGDLLSSSELPVDAFRRYVALVDPQGRLVARGCFAVEPGRWEVRDASGAVLLATRTSGAPVWEWPDGSEGPQDPERGFATDPDLRTRSRLQGARLTRTTRPVAPGMPFWTVALTDRVPPAQRVAVQALRLLPTSGTGFVGRV